MLPNDRLLLGEKKMLESSQQCRLANSLMATSIFKQGQDQDKGILPSLELMHCV